MSNASWKVLTRIQQTFLQSRLELQFTSQSHLFSITDIFSFYFSLSLWHYGTVASQFLRLIHSLSFNQLFSTLCMYIYTHAKTQIKLCFQCFLIFFCEVKKLPHAQHSERYQHFFAIVIFLRFRLTFARQLQKLLKYLPNPGICVCTVSCLSSSGFINHKGDTL